MKNESKEVDQEFVSHGPNEFNNMSINSGSQLEQLRQEFSYLAAQSHVTVNIAVTKIRKILAQHNIFIENDFPRFAEDEGEYFFTLLQHDSDIRVWEFDNDEDPNAPKYYEQPEMYLYLYFMLNATGFFNIEAKVVNYDELVAIVGEDEVEDI